MSSRSELKQLQAMDSESEEEQPAGSEERESDSEEERREEKENDSEEEGEEEGGIAEAEKEEDSGAEANVPDKEDEEDSDSTKKRSGSKGKSLLIRFPYALTTDDKVLGKYMEKLCSRIIRVRRTTKDSECMVYFASPEDREESLEELEKIKIDEHNLYIEKGELKQKRIEAGEKRTLNFRGKQEYYEKLPLTSSIIVRNIPPEATVLDIKRLFPRAINIEVIPDNWERSMATIKLRTSREATLAQRNVYEICNTRLIVHFARPNNHNFNKQYEPETAKGNNLFARDSSMIKSRKHKLEEPSSSESSSPRKVRQLHGEQTDDGEDGVKNIQKTVSQKNPPFRPNQRVVKVIKISRNEKGKTIKQYETQVLPFNNPNQFKSWKQFNQFHPKNINNKVFRKPYDTDGAHDTEFVENERQLNKSNEIQIENGKGVYNKKQKKVNQLENGKQSKKENPFKNEKKLKKEYQFEKGDLEKLFQTGKA